MAASVDEPSFMIRPGLIRLYSAPSESTCRVNVYVHSFISTRFQAARFNVKVVTLQSHSTGGANPQNVPESWWTGNVDQLSVMISMRCVKQTHTQRQTERRTRRRTRTTTRISRRWSTGVRCRIEKASETHLSDVDAAAAADAAAAIRPFSWQASISRRLTAVSGVVSAVAVNGLMDGQPGVILWRPSWWPFNATSWLSNRVTPYEVIRTDSAPAVATAANLLWYSIIHWQRDDESLW